MKARLRKAVPVALCLVLLGGSLVLAQGRGPGFGPGPHGRMGRGPGPMAGALHQLDLTDEQRDQVRATVQEKMQGQLGDLMRQARQARRDLERLVADPTAGEAAVLDAAHQAGLAGEQLAVERHRLAVAIGKILTDEQRQQFLQLLEEGPGRGPMMRRRPHGCCWDE